MRRIRPLAMVDVTTLPWARPVALNSPAYFAAPVTFARPSTRDVGVAMYDVMDLLTCSACCPAVAAYGPAAPNVPSATAPCGSQDLLTGLRLWRALRGLSQRAYDAAACQVDLERIVRVALGVAQQKICRAPESGRIGRLPAPGRFGPLTPPR